MWLQEVKLSRLKDLCSQGNVNWLEAMSGTFFECFERCDDLEEKRKIIGREFIRWLFEQAARNIVSKPVMMVKKFVS